MTIKRKTYIFCALVGITATCVLFRRVPTISHKSKGDAKVSDLIGRKGESMNASNKSTAPQRGELSMYTDPKEAMRKAARDPNWRSARYNESYLRIEARYGRFLLRSKWTPERKEQFKALLANNDVAVFQAALEESYDSDGKAIGSLIADTRTECEARLKAAMDSEEMQAFKQCQVEDNYQSPVADLTNAMRAQGIEISNDLEQTLLSAYASAAIEASMQNGAANVVGLGDQELAVLKAAQAATFHTILLTHISPILNEEQANAFIAAEVERTQ